MRGNLFPKPCRIPKQHRSDKTKSAALEPLVLGVDRRGELGDKGVRGNLGGEDLNNQADNRKPGHVIEMQSEVSTRLKRALNTKILFP